MTNRAALIIRRIVELLSDLKTTQGNVSRGRVYNIQESELPHISVFRGPNEPVSEQDQNTAFADWNLTVRIEVHVQSITEYLDEDLATIEREIALALKEDVTLGLDYVHSIDEEGATEPTIDNEGHQPIAAMGLTYRVKYRRSTTDPGG